jgi:hypothetical protein
VHQQNQPEYFTYGLAFGVIALSTLCILGIFMIVRKRIQKRQRAIEDEKRVGLPMGTFSD